MTARSLILSEIDFDKDVNFFTGETFYKSKIQAIKEVLEENDITMCEDEIRTEIADLVNDQKASILEDIKEHGLVKTIHSNKYSSRLCVQVHCDIMLELNKTSS
jgi:hypothetical protein